MGFVPGVLVGITIAVWGFLLIVAFVLYLLTALMRMRVFKMFGTCSSICAFVPFLGSFMMGRTCKGRDGQNTGLFGLSVPNLFWELGWLSYTACITIGGFTDGATASVLETVGMLAMWFYWGSVWSFVFSRMGRRSQSDVTVVAILAAIFWPVAMIKVLTNASGVVYSLPNDEYSYDNSGRYY